MPTDLSSQPTEQVKIQEPLQPGNLKRGGKSGKLKKILISIFVVLCLAASLGIFLFIYFPQIWLVPRAKSAVPKNEFPLAYTTPTLRQVKSPDYNLEKYPEFSYYGIKFKTPWSQVIKQKEIGGNAGNGSLVGLEFPENKTIAIFNNYGGIDYLAEFSGGKSPGDVAKVKSLFGGEVLSSNYNFVRQVLNTNIEDITILTPRKEAVAKSILFLSKMVVLVPTSSKGGFYNFETAEIKGFQYGGPGVAKTVIIQFFDKNDREHRILISGTATQDEIDFILSTTKTQE